MQETYPTLEYIRLCAGGAIDETAPVLGTEFLGGSAPCLERFWLKGIPFPDAPQLILSTSNLVDLVMEKIPDSGYFSPEVMITALSTCTKLERIHIDFIKNPHPDLTNRQIASIIPISLPTLISFVFDGHGKYYHDFISRIENPLFPLEGDFDINTANIRVHCEAFLIPSGRSFHYSYVYLMGGVPVEE
jgi:hypothetical protein